MIPRRALAAAVIFTLATVLAGCSREKVQTNGPFLANFSPSQASSSHWESRRPEPLPETAPKKPTVRSTLAMARLSERRGQASQAQRLYLAVIKREPNNPVPYHRLAVISAGEGDFAQSEKYFRKACELAPTNPELLADLGYSYYLQHRLAEAEESLQRALELAPDDPAVCNNLAIVLAEKGRYQESLVLFKRAGSEAQALGNLAFMYAQRGELERAKACYSRALALDGNLRPAAEAMVQLARYNPANFPAPPQGDLRHLQVAQAPVAELPQSARRVVQREPRRPPETAHQVQPAGHRQGYPSGGPAYPEPQATDTAVAPVQTPPEQMPPVHVPPVQVSPVQMSPVQMPPVQMPPVQMPPVQMPPVQAASVQMSRLQMPGSDPVERHSIVSRPRWSNAASITCLPEAGD